jgi:hypothetical protein
MVNLIEVRNKIQRVLSEDTSLITPTGEKTIWDEVGLGDTARYLGLDDNLNDVRLSPNQHEIAMSMNKLTMGFEFEICVEGARWYEEAADTIKAEMKKRARINATVKHNKDDPQGKREWVIKPDGSIRPSGGELISPPFTGTAKGKQNLEAVLDVINASPKLFTNETTGLHMTFGSFPNTKDGSRLDLVKLTIAVNEKQILNTYGRGSNRFTAATELKGPLSDGGWVMPRDRAAAIALFKSNPTDRRLIVMFDMIKARLQVRVRNDLNVKYKATNFMKLRNNGLIEFRGVGNLYAQLKDDSLRALERYAWAIYVAANPGEWVNMYHKRLLEIMCVQKISK